MSLEKMSKIITIGFDGLHRAGKGTQEQLLSNYLNSLSIPNVIIRGHGTRAGSIERVYDSPSLWWQENLLYFRQEGSSPQENAYKMGLRFQRLNREARVVIDRILPHKISKESGTGIVLMDRSFISHYFCMKQFFPKISIDDALTVYNPKNGEKIDPIFLDITIVMSADKETLLERARESDNGTEEFKFKFKIIEKYYDLFQQTVEELSLRGDVKVIDSSGSIEQVHTNIKDICNKLLKNG